MFDRPDAADNLFILVVYALAAISGGLGGCVVWSYYTRVSRRITAFVIAYMIVGLVFGVVAAAVGLWTQMPWTLHELIVFGVLSGVGGAVAVFGVNWGAGIAFKWKNFEVKFTIRKPPQNRRATEEER